VFSPQAVHSQALNNDKWPVLFIHHKAKVISLPVLASAKTHEKSLQRDNKLPDAFRGRINHPPTNKVRRYLSLAIVFGRN
jgi:hypothetical protein